MGLKNGFRVMGLLLFIFFIYIGYRHFDLDYVFTQAWRLWTHPGWIVAISVCYGLAFICRALAWKWYMRNRLPFATYLHALFYSLFINHLLPVKAGDLVRAGVIRGKEVGWEESLHSVLVMRLMDLIVLGFMAGAGAMVFGFYLSMDLFWLMLASIILGGAMLHLLSRTTKGNLIKKHLRMIKQAFNGPQGFKIVVFVILSWLLEAVVLLGVSATSGLGLSGLEAIWVNSVTIAGQVFHFTPGGIGNYESIMSFSLVGLGFSWQQAYTVALISHGYKFVFAYLVGIYVVLRHPLHWDDLLKWTRGRRDPGQ
jgi:hypothetical protein